MSEADARVPHGTPCWVSLLVHDLPAAQDFYGGLFGWRFRPGPRQLGPYRQALLDGRLVAGIGELPADRPLPKAWTTYFASDDAGVTAERITENGGTVAVGPVPTDAGGRMAVAADPCGAVFGLWEAGDGTSLDVRDEPGALAWNELVTRESIWVDKFYTAVFRATAEEAPTQYAGRAQLSVGGRPVAGITSMGELPEDRGPYWMAFFAVEDVEAAEERVVELGGTRRRGSYDSPYGRQATVADPEGSVFALMERKAAG